ncbi:hypothetical protein D3C81_1522550 [compost metagenome]
MLALCGSIRLMAILAEIMAICIRPTRKIPMTLPNICVSGEALVIRISIMRELFSEVTSAEIIFPVMVIDMKNRIRST